MNRIIYLLKFVLVFACKLEAAHIIGGDVTYECVSSNAANQTTTFNIVFTMYRDAAGGGAPFDNPARFGLFSTSDDINWQFEESLQQVPESIEDIDFTDPCISFPPDLAVEKGVYRFQITLPWNGRTFKLAYQRCCRNNTIINIVNPGETGAVFSIDFLPESIRNCNSSPVFNSFPPFVICINQEIKYESFAIDADGDSLVYELCNPFTAGGTDGATTPGDPNDCTGVTPNPAICLPPFDLVEYLLPTFSFDNPLGGNTNVNIDPVTGLLNGIPDALGQYVIGVCINEYRDGVLISKVRRDFQFNVANCDLANSTQNFEICEGDTVIVNDEIYTDEGIYIQEFPISASCDSTVTIFVDFAEETSVDLAFDLCEGDSIVIKGEVYNSPGQYQQFIDNNDDCDSLLKITITGLESGIGTTSATICEGETIIINGEVYDKGGEYTQVLTGVNGCDSTLTIKISEISDTEETINRGLCEGDSLEINGVVYTEPGVKEQMLVNVEGCDSTLIIKIVGLDKKAETLSFELCSGDTIVVAGKIFTEPGITDIVLPAANGCDSTLTIKIMEQSPMEGTLDTTICSGSTIIINDITYDSPGVFEQELTTQNNCDSLLKITIIEGLVEEESLFFSLCSASGITVNGQTYTQAGQYTQELTSSNGCDSLLIINLGPCDELIYYDFEGCDASKDHSNVYDEFEPFEENTLSCGEVEGSNVYRINPDENRHSCTEGNQGSIAMCVGSLDTCDYVADSEKAIRFNISVSPDDNAQVNISLIEFYHRSPLAFDWINGASGDNNYPTLYGIRVLIDGQEVYREVDLATGDNWRLKTLNFEGDVNFNFNTNTTSDILVELTPYCRAGVDAFVSAWDVDDIRVFGGCIDEGSRVIAGRIDGVSDQHTEMPKVFLAEESGDIEWQFLDANHSFTFPMGNIDEEYTLFATAKVDDLLLMGIDDADFTAIENHILGLKPLLDPKQLIAADINNDQRITMTDVTLLRQSVMGLRPTFMNNVSWKFVDAEALSQMTDPWATIESIKINPSKVDYSDLRLIAIKIGDVVD